MKTVYNKIFNLSLIAILFSTALTVSAQVRAYRVTDRQVDTLITRIESRTDTFRRQIERYYDRNETQSRDQLLTYVNDFENATDSLKNNFSSRRSSAADVQEVLNRAAFLENAVRGTRINANIRSQWNLLRTDLNTLANYYSVSWNWNNNPNYPTYPGNQYGFDARLTGTYRLNTSRSDNVNDVISRELNNLNLNNNQENRIRRNLERRLTPPDMLMIEKRGQQITLGTTNTQQVSFNADGVSRTETNPNGRSVNIRASSSSNDLTINYEGDRMNDYFVSFMPMTNGQLRVTRRVYLENRNETVTVNSIYDKIDQVARWSNNYPTYPNTGGNYNNDFIVPNNTRIVASLNNELSTRSYRDGDKFSMTVNSPSQYAGAVIEGRVNGQKSGVVSGRASLAFDFDTIRLRNGSTYRFAGIVDQVREPDGDVVSVNNEGQVRDGNQTTRTVTRAGIGAALGAIIGAIAGGGEGAAIGAGIGAGAGAGSVVLQGRDNLELPTGTQFSLTATAPYNR